MKKLSGNRTGLAGELRVMSELLLRDHNPSKSYLEEGADLVLENGLRVEVKSSHLRKRQGSILPNYHFTLKGGSRQKPQNLAECEFLILWCIEDNCFFVVPLQIIPQSQRAIGITNINGNGKYQEYKERWSLLDREVKDEYMSILWKNYQ